MPDDIDLFDYDMFALVRAADNDPDRVAALTRLRETYPFPATVDAAIRRARSGASPVERPVDVYEWLDDEIIEVFGSGNDERIAAESRKVDTVGERLRAIADAHPEAEVELVGGLAVLLERVVVSSPDTLGGTPRFRGTRVSVETLFDGLADGLSLAEVLDAYPTLDRDDCVLAIRQASYLLRRHADGKR